MTIFILRRFTQALISILLTALVFHAYFMYVAPTAIYKQYNIVLAQLAQPGDPGPAYGWPASTYPDTATYYREVFKADHLWPLNFLLWLFDPNATMRAGTGDEVGTLVPQGIRLDLFGLHIAGSGLLTGDFGASTVSDGRSVGSLLTDRWTNSLLLIGTALFFALLVAIPVGIIGALKQHSRLDTGLTFLTFTSLSMPPFMLGFVLSALFGIIPNIIRQQTGWDWFPILASGYVHSLDQEGNWINRIYHMILPVATLALAMGALLARHVRFSMLEVFSQDYIRTALAKGVPVRRVVALPKKCGS